MSKKSSILLLASILLIVTLLVSQQGTQAHCSGIDCPHPTAIHTPTAVHTPTAIPSTTATPTHYYTFIPMVQFQLWQGCKYPIPMGAAWMYRDYMPLLLRNAFCIDDGYYADRVNHDDGGIPILRPIQSNIEDRLQALEDYTGDYLISNEPDTADQDNMTPCETAEFIRQVEERIPNGRAIWWNGYKLNHLSATLDCYGGIPSGIVGIHGYSIDSTYGGSVENLINATCAILAAHGKNDCNVVISELAVCSQQSAPYDKMTRWLTQMEQNADRIDHIYWFTHYPESPSWESWCGSNFWYLSDNGAFSAYMTTAGGDALFSYVHDGEVYDPYWFYQ